MFVRFSCDCVGFIPVVEPGLAASPVPWVVKPCDGDGHSDPISIGPRDDLGHKSHTPLTLEQQLALLIDLGRLVADGYRFRTIHSLLRIS